MFDSHPVLKAVIDIDASVKDQCIWSLPRSTDDVAFDSQKATEHAETLCNQRERTFQEALKEKNADEALRQFALCFEETSAAAGMDVNKMHANFLQVA